MNQVLVRQNKAETPHNCITSGPPAAAAVDSQQTHNIGSQACRHPWPYGGAQAQCAARNLEMEVVSWLSQSITYT